MVAPRPQPSDGMPLTICATALGARPVPVASSWQMSVNPSRLLSAEHRWSRRLTATTLPFVVPVAVLAALVVIGDAISSRTSVFHDMPDSANLASTRLNSGSTGLHGAEFA